jgi:GT2 family glycosyltransferase
LRADDRVAAVVVAFNGGSELLECIGSLRTQTVSHLEVVVVDNASTDGSIERAESQFGDDIRVVRREHNGGYAVGANEGWHATRARIVAILNQDVTLAPDCLAQMRRALEDSPTEAVVSPKLVLKTDPSRVNAVGLDVHVSGVSWCRGLGSEAADWQGVVEMTSISGAAFMARRPLLEALGGLDESFFMYMEDVDLSFRARLAGATCLVACDAVARHSWSLALTPWKFELLERNRRRIWDRHIGSAGGRWLVLLQVEAMGWVYAALRGRGYLRAKLRTARTREPREAIAPSRTSIIVSNLAAIYPYDVVFPNARAVVTVGRLVDKIVGLWLKAAARRPTIGMDRCASVRDDRRRHRSGMAATVLATTTEFAGERKPKRNFDEQADHHNANDAARDEASQDRADNSKQRSRSDDSAEVAQSQAGAVRTH